MRKHGIDFDDAKQVFFAYHVIDYDQEHSHREARWRAMGEVKGRVITVGYAESHRNTIRIITARRSTKDETIRYYAQTFGEPVGGGRRRGKRKH